MRRKLTSMEIPASFNTQTSHFHLMRTFEKSLGSSLTRPSRGPQPPSATSLESLTHRRPNKQLASRALHPNKFQIPPQRHHAPAPPSMLAWAHPNPKLPLCHRPHPKPTFYKVTPPNIHHRLMASLLRPLAPFRRAHRQLNAPAQHHRNHNKHPK